MRGTIAILASLLALLTAPLTSSAADEFPPGWLPISMLDDQPVWNDHRKTIDKIQLYLPSGDKPVRGVFICFVFHSSDPRELARLWNFALVTVPPIFEYDLGHNDRRTGRFKAGHAMQNMGLLLRYLDEAAKKTSHNELSTVPLVGWLGQNGSHLCADLFKRAPERVLAWSDSFPNRLRQFPKLTNAVPFAFAWEISNNEVRAKLRKQDANDKPLADLSARANTYGFGHGIYSKYNYFVAFIDRCIAQRMPDEMPPPGQPVKLKPVSREAGWIGDYDPVSEWNPIHRADSPEAKSAKYPVWMPDEYAAAMWRSYHSANPDIKIAGPVVEYRKKDNKWGGPECGLGYDGYLAASANHTFIAQMTGTYTKVIFYSGHRALGEASGAPWTVENVKLEPGLHALYAVGVNAEGKQTASRPAFAICR